MNDNELELAELVATRISHDLIGSIGAISNVLELIGDSTQLEDGDRSILTLGAETLCSRQKFFRVAFGVDTKHMDTGELTTLCQNYLATVGSRGCPIKLELNNASPELAKLISLCVMTAAEVFIKGGTIHININAQNMNIRTCSDYKLSASKLAAYQEILSGKKPQENISQYVQLFYLKTFLGNDVPFKMTTSETSMELTIG